MAMQKGAEALNASVLSVTQEASSPLVLPRFRIEYMGEALVVQVGKDRWLIHVVAESTMADLTIKDAKTFIENWIAARSEPPPEREFVGWIAEKYHVPVGTS